MVFNSKVVPVFMLWLPKISGSSVVLNFDEWTLDRGKEKITHSERALFKGRFYNPRISHASIRLFQAHLERYRAITTDGASIRLRLGRLVQCQHIVCWSHALHLSLGTSSTKNAAIEVCRIQNKRV